MAEYFYLEMGLFNSIIMFIVFYRIFGDRKEFKDCELLCILLAFVFFVTIIDTIGWELDGQLRGNYIIIVNIIDALNLACTAGAAWSWARYARYLAYEDVGKTESKAYLNNIVFLVQLIAVCVAIPTKYLYYIDSNGVYSRSTGFIAFMLLCLIQLIYSIFICLYTRRKVQSIQKRKELLAMGLIIVLPIFGTVLQGIFYGYPLIWTCMTILLLVVYIHIQDKRRVREKLDQKEQLISALQQAQYANKAKTRFLSNMSHDIRTPMNAIVGFTAIAASHIDEKEIVQNSLGKIMTSSNHLLNLINDILDMSRIESGKMNLQIVPCNLATVMHDIVDMIQSQINANQLELFIDTLHVRDEEILADPMKLNQIFINLISNAIKFNHPGGVVSIRIEQKETADANMGSYIFTVKDNGIGISSESAEHIFEPFERAVEDSPQENVQGTGLGLAIVKNIVDMMGGTITVSSELGKGSEFKVGLSFGLQNKETSERSCDMLKNLRALVADDDYDTCDSVTSMLTEIGMKAEWTLTGKEAVLKAKKATEVHDSYSAYIIDWLMPDMNGIEVTRRIRSVIGDDVPIFILTAYDWSDIEQEAKDAGVTAFCRKPLFMSELRQTLIESAGVTEKTIEKETKVDFSEIFKGKRALLAEDHPLNREIAVRLLIDKGFKVEEAEDGRIALEKFKLSREGYYDIILTDIRMPNLTGYETAEQIRKLQRSDAKTIPIIAMTANAFEEDKQMALDAGMNEHISKPLNVQEMFEKLSEYFK